MRRGERRRRELNRERGSMAAAAGISVLLLSVLAMGVVSIGRLSAVRMDLQRSADAASLAAADIIRQRGMPFDNDARQAAENIASRNSAQSLDFQWQVRETADAVFVDVTVSAEVDLPELAFDGGRRTVSANASGKVDQTRFDEAERRIPKLVLVLDYSGSMSLPFSGGGGAAIDVLEDSVEGLLNADLMIDYGAVFYSTSVFRTHGIGPSAPNRIINSMNRYGAGGSTNTAAGLRRGRDILRATDNTGYHMLLVSDGEPCCAGNSFSAARAAARAAWNSDITIFTLEIRRSGSSRALDRFMTDVAGSPTSRGDRNYHFVATSAADLIDEFENIVANIVCKVGPMTPPPTDLSRLRVYLSNGGNERVLPATDDLVRDRGIEAFQFETSDNTIRLTETACDGVIENGDEVVARYGKPSLTD